MREALLEAGAEMFAELGYERTRVADIVLRAETAHGNFYRHFKDKDEILIAILEPFIEALRVGSGRAAHPQKSSAVVAPTEKDLVASNLAFFTFYAKHRRLLRVMREASSHGGETSSFLELWLRQRGTFVDRTDRWLTRLQRADLISADIQCRDTAEALGSMTEQLAFVKIGLAARTPRRAEIERLAQTCGRIWFSTLFGAKP